MTPQARTIRYPDSMVTMLDWFRDVHSCSCATVGYIAEENGTSRETARKNLQALMGAGYVEILHEPTGLYQLRSDPRDDDSTGQSQ